MGFSISGLGDGWGLSLNFYSCVEVASSIVFIDIVCEA